MIPEPSDFQRQQAEELRLPLVWAKAYQVDSRSWGWLACTDPADWFATSVVASHRALEQPTRERALSLARSWGGQRGVLVGDLP